MRGSVPLALFGPKGYGEVLGILATPYLVLNALAPMIFMVLCRTSFGACPLHGVADIDPVAMLHTHLDLVLRGLQVRPAT